MGRLTTHVLDTARGRPAAGITIELYAFGEERRFLSAATTDEDGRCPRPLLEDGSVKSSSSTVVNLELGYKRSRYDVRVDVLNLFDSDDDDITYWYASRLPGEPADGVEDFHFHPIEPRTVRASFGWKF